MRRQAVGFRDDPHAALRPRAIRHDTADALRVEWYVSERGRVRARGRATGHDTGQHDGDDGGACHGSCHFCPRGPALGRLIGYVCERALRVYRCPASR